MTTGCVRRKLKLCAAGLLPAPGLSLLLRCLEQFGEKAAVSLLSSLGAYFVGSTLTTLIPFAPLQIPVAVGTTYALGRVVTEWLKAGKPADLSPFKTVYDDALREAKKNIELFKNDPKKDEPLGDESKKYDL